MMGGIRNRDLLRLLLREFYARTIGVYLAK